MEHVSSIITAAGGLLVGVFTTAFGYKHKMRKQESAAENSHLRTFYDTVNEALKDQEARHAKAISELRTELREERAQQAAERAQWAQEQKVLQSKLDEYVRLNHEKDLEVVQLRAEVKIFEQRLNTVTK